ncbi:MAG: CBO2463/CBO2479 domain-containing protein [Muricomes sp.]
MIEYQINPALMGGVVKEISKEGIVKINLNGRLGVIKIPRALIIDSVKLEPGHQLRFYFSYIQVVENPYEYDSSEMNPDCEMNPTLLSGKITIVNDTAIEAEIMDGLGSVAVPRRWVFTPLALEAGQDCEFYLSCMQVVGKQELPEESIQNLTKRRQIS